MSNPMYNPFCVYFVNDPFDKTPYTYDTSFATEAEAEAYVERQPNPNEYVIMEAEA